MTRIKKTPENVAVAEKLFAQGVPQVEIARKLGVCRQSINQWLRPEQYKKSWTKANRKRTPERIILAAAKTQAKKRGYAPPDISEDELRRRYRSHSRVCEVCGRAEEGKRLHLDHCHTTGKVRGFLCGPCNQGIGLLQESEFILWEAVKYISKR